MSTFSVPNDERTFAAAVAPYRRELRAYCYRMAGSIDDADDLLQESLLRAWRGLPGFDGRASLRTWLYRVASSACIDRLKNRNARKRAEDLGPPGSAQDDAPLGDMDAFIGPCPADVYVVEEVPSPEARYDARESVGFAFLAALQLLPPKQRATLIACDVLGFSAEECASVLETSASSVESALRRARETIDARGKTWEPTTPSDHARDVIAQWVDAWSRSDSKALVELLHADATMSMPPLPLWMRGSASIIEALDAMVFAGRVPGDFRALPTEANGLPALGIYRRESDGPFAPFALQVLGMDGGKVRTFTAFIDTRFFSHFGLPL